MPPPSICSSGGQNELINGEQFINKVIFSCLQRVYSRYNQNRDTSVQLYSTLTVQIYKDNGGG